MIKKIKNIFNLTKIFFKSSFQNPYIIDKNTNKLNKKSPFVWLMIIVMITISYLSFEVVKFLVKINQPTIFLNTFFMILNIIIIFQIILASFNVYFFSKDLELILPLPIKSEDLLISKFNTILINIYFSELIFALIPLLIYGILTNSGILYYLFLIIILIIFPILANLIVSIITMIFMKFSKFIKNKDIFQIIITLFFIGSLILLEFFIINNITSNLSDNTTINSENIINGINTFNEKIKNINKYFLIINPIINILNNYNKINIILDFLKIIFINLLFLILFILIGKKYYLKNILKNNNYYIKMNNKKINDKKFEKNNKLISYIKKEFKMLFKNLIFFIQSIFPTLILTVSLIIITVIALPNLQQILTTNSVFEEVTFSVDLSVICLILGLIQIIFTMSNISISAISREGKNAQYMKFLPIDFYKQFICKSIPQIIINAFVVMVVLFLIKLIFPTFEIIYVLLLFILGNLINILNSNLMVLVDLIKPNLDWNADYEAIKNGNNKLFQYAFTILMILILVYFYNIFSDINLILACILIIFILIILILILNKIIKININKLFKKIK